VPNGWLRGAYMQQPKPRVVKISPLQTNVVAGDVLLATPGAISRRLSLLETEKTEIIMMISVFFDRLVDCDTRHASLVLYKVSANSLLSCRCSEPFLCYQVV